jgi:osmotically inducible protein OsmC
MDSELRYAARAEAREGGPPRVSGEEGRIVLDLATPRELGGSGGDGASAEGLLAAGYAACLLSALRYEATRTGADLKGAEVFCLADVSAQDGTFRIGFSLEVSLPSTPKEQAQQLLDSALAAWPFGPSRDQQRPAIALRPRTERVSPDALGAVRQEATAGRGYGG